MEDLAQHSTAAQREAAGTTQHNVNGMEQHCIALATQRIPVCNFHQLSLTCTAAKIAPFSTLMTEVTNTLGETGGRDIRGFPLKMSWDFGRPKTNRRMTRVCSAPVAFPRFWHVRIQLVDLDFWNLLLPCQVQLTKSTLQLTPKCAILITRHHSVLSVLEKSKQE